MSDKILRLLQNFVLAFVIGYISLPLKKKYI